ncbi:MAG: hypothetical protein IT314_10145 [Anaerolineales bacterium]|nr:hypothetical protein [Anaerolineales bacterium]
MQALPAEAKIISMLLSRLERISADSVWAHRASGLRGSLLRALEQAEEGTLLEPADLKSMTRAAFHILREAAKGIR